MQPSRSSSLRLYSLTLPRFVARVVGPAAALSRTAFCVAFAVASALAQQASTLPVGAVKVDLQPASKPGEFAYLGTSFPRDPVYRGKVSAGTGTRLTDTSAAWAINQFNPVANAAPRTHYVEFLSGVMKGLLVDIRATSATVLELDFDFGAASIAGVDYVIRPHWTLAALLGGSILSGLKGGLPPAVDMFSLWNGTAYEEFYCRVPTNGASGWRRTGDEVTDRSTTVVYPDQGIFVKFSAKTGATAMQVGQVQSGPMMVPIERGFNLVNPNLPIPMTLGASGLYTGTVATGLKTGAPTTADTVSIWNGSGFDDYYVRAIGSTVQGWRKTGNISVDCAGVPIPAGVAIVIRRKADVPAFVWNRPSVY